MSTKKGATAAAQSKATKNSKGKESAKVTNEDDESDKEDEKDKYPWKEGDNLAQLLKEKYKETEKLKVLLETMEPIPGMDPDKYNQFVFNGIDDAFDFRDTKIVTLAKKVRNLSMKLNKINALNEASKKDLHELRGQYDELKSNHDSILQKEKKQEDTNKPETEKRLQKELVAANKTIEELKRRQHQLNDEVKNLQRALRSELGDGTPLDQAYDATWKGRAELVTMLKVRLKKYETGMIGMSTIDNNRNNSTIGGGRGGISSHTSSRVFDVIAELGAERKQASDSLVSQYAELKEENYSMEHKIKGFKARMQTTEKEVIKYKQQIQLLLNKADTDDELINALRSEINNMKFSSTSGTYKAQVPDHIESSNEQVEITRLKRQCKQQADQLNTQDELIRELRFHIK